MVSTGLDDFNPSILVSSNDCTVVVYEPPKPAATINDYFLPSSRDARVGALPSRSFSRCIIPPALDNNGKKQHTPVSVVDNPQAKYFVSGTTAIPE